VYARDFAELLTLYTSVFLMYDAGTERLLSARCRDTEWNACVHVEGDRAKQEADMSLLSGKKKRGKKEKNSKMVTSAVNLHAALPV